MGDHLATLFTMTTYGSWLRGDSRGWVEDNVTYPPNLILEEGDRKRMKHPAFMFASQDLFRIGEMIGKSLKERLGQRILAMTVQRWHVHFVVMASEVDIPKIAKCAKDAVRWGMRPGRPIWTDGYDKRYCFDDQSVGNRIEYVERHNLEAGWPARPWKFIDVPSF